jgi:sugar O-acyltransferase (sialic acid O-acetyltransferase NeuD family)
MKTIYVVGGDGFARECYQNLLLSAEQNSDINFGGFIGHNGYKVDFKSLNHLFAGDLSEIEFKDNDYAVIGAGYPELRKKIYDDLKEKGVKLHNLISPSVKITETVEIGEGNVFAPPCMPSVYVKIGSGNVFNGDVIIGHDAIIGDFNFFGPKSQVLGSVQIGNMNTIGAASLILPKAKIGDNNKIAPLSAVYKGCKNNGYYIGNPALRVGEA